eukprot:TRINITY_DN14873_c0_g1_i2.p1 TRINITY_DN14873_c0_g1~~TRINITY_DN14873_c0_g1_i2.p1  ORF type:complete len:203 (-),score=41.91 TRINITY_DN14873_c0_g1_i2:322-930(-)
MKGRRLLLEDVQGAQRSHSVYNNLAANVHMDGVDFEKSSFTIKSKPMSALEKLNIDHISELKPSISTPKFTGPNTGIPSTVPLIPKHKNDPPTAKDCELSFGNSKNPSLNSLHKEESNTLGLSLSLEMIKGLREDMSEPSINFLMQVQDHQCKSFRSPKNKELADLREAMKHTKEIKQKVKSSAYTAKIMEKFTENSVTCLT